MSFIGDLFKSGQSSSNTIDPQIKALLMQNYNTAQGVANTPFQPFTGERVAPFTPTQIQGQQGLIGAANDPTSANTINQAGGVLAGLTGYQPQTIAATPLSGVDLSKYMNPYQKDVIDASISQNQFARDQQGVRDNASATAAKAFGGTRQAVQRALTTEGYDRNNQQNLAALNSANFDQAQRGAQFDIGNALTASGQNAAYGNQAAGLRLNAGNSLASIGDQQLKDALTKAGVINQVGNQQQALGQQQDDAAYQEFLRMINYPREQQDIRNSALGFLPKDNTQTTTNSPSPLSMIGSIASIAAPFFSDERTKENIETVGYDERGRRWVDFNYKWDGPEARYRGVIAQEVLETDPMAVSEDPVTGYLMVDYSKLGAH
jgi:hypothetical protein